MTGHDIKAAIEKIGVPEGLTVLVSPGAVAIETHDDRAAALLDLELRYANQTRMVAYPDHPRAMECAALLLKAHRDVRLGS